MVPVNIRARDAIQNGASGTYVYLVNADQTVSMHLVTTGATENDRVAITKGLKPGDTVVVDGADQLRDGAHVTVLPARRHSRHLIHARGNHLYAVGLYGFHSIECRLLKYRPGNPAGGVLWNVKD